MIIEKIQQKNMNKGRRTFVALSELTIILHFTMLKLNYKYSCSLQRNKKIKKYISKKASFDIFSTVYIQLFKSSKFM